MLTNDISSNDIRFALVFSQSNFFTFDPVIQMRHLSHSRPYLTLMYYSICSVRQIIAVIFIQSFSGLHSIPHAEADTNIRQTSPILIHRYGYTSSCRRSIDNPFVHDEQHINLELHHNANRSLKHNFFVRFFSNLENLIRPSDRQIRVFPETSKTWVKNAAQGPPTSFALVTCQSKTPRAQPDPVGSPHLRDVLRETTPRPTMLHVAHVRSLLLRPGRRCRHALATSPLLGRYRIVPVDLFRINASEKVVLRDYAVQQRHGPTPARI